MQPQQTTEFGFFTCICTADALAASRMSSFAYMLTESLPSDVGSVLDEAQTLLHDCLAEDLCAAVREGQEAAKVRFNQYKAAMHAVRVASATERSRLESTLTSESAADAAVASAAAAATATGRDRASSALSSGGRSDNGDSNANTSSNNNIVPTSTDPMGHRGYTGQVQKNDVFVALREYRVAVLTADSLITQYVFILLYYCSSFLFMFVTLSLSTIYCCLPAFSDTTAWHESNHHPLTPSINHSSIDTILTLLIITIQVRRLREATAQSSTFAGNSNSGAVAGHGEDVLP
jgi:hypothetical protein